MLLQFLGKIVSVGLLFRRVLMRSNEDSGWILMFWGHGWGQLREHWRVYGTLHATPRPSQISRSLCAQASGCLLEQVQKIFFILYIISTLCPAHISPSERVQFGKSQNLNSFKMCFEVKMGAQLRHLEVELRKLKKQMDVGFSLWGCCLSVPVNFKAQCPNSPCRRHLRWLWSWACVTVRCPWSWVSPTLGPRRDVRDRERQWEPIASFPL